MNGTLDYFIKLEVRPDPVSRRKKSKLGPERIVKLNESYDLQLFLFNLLLYDSPLQFRRGRLR